MSRPELDVAILRTLLYADVFDYALTVQEIQRYLIGRAEPLDTIDQALRSSAWLGDRITRVNGYVAARGQEALVDRRERRAVSSAALWREAHRWARWNGSLPFVRMVAVTGALAVSNSDHGDDIDLLLVTRPGRVWTARAFAILLVRVARLLGVRLCPNYLMAETALEQARRDLFTAHELAQMVPLVGFVIYHQMRESNRWAGEYLPNAPNPPRTARELHPARLSRWLQRVLEWLLGGGLGDWFEEWERDRKLRKFADAANDPGADAILDSERVKGHFNDYGPKVLEAYRERLKQWELE